MHTKPVYCTDVHETSVQYRFGKLEKLTIKRKEKGEHTCPEVLIKLSELIKGLSTNTNYNLAILSVFTVLKYGQIAISIC